MGVDVPRRAGILQALYLIRSVRSILSLKSVQPADDVAGTSHRDGLISIAYQVCAFQSTLPGEATPA